MTAEEVMARDDFRRCERFHGHVCPGLSLGYVAAKGALQWLREHRAEDEELVAVVENDACFVDAVQVLTGCTFGKGNFFFQDHGKMALTLYSRNKAKGVRLCLKAQILDQDDEHGALMQKVMSGEADDLERERFAELHRQKSERILTTPVEELFTLSPARGPLPEKARIEPSVACDGCGEPAMGSKMVEVEGRKLCRGCAQA